MTEPAHIGSVLQARTERMASEAPREPTSGYSLSVDLDLEGIGAVGDDVLARRSALWSQVIPSRFSWATLDDIDGEAREVLEEWSAEPKGRNLVLFGAVGVGKTHAAVAACRAAHFNGIDVAFTPIVELLDDLRPGGREGAYDDAVNAGRLILDDMGAERATDWTHERMYAVINRRWLEERPTVVTSNLEQTAFREAIGERLFSRLVGSGSLAVMLAGRDRRRSRR